MRIRLTTIGLLAATALVALSVLPARADVNSSLGINLWNHWDWGTDWAFVDKFKSNRNFVEILVSGSGERALSDPDPVTGYPRSIPSGYRVRTLINGLTHVDNYTKCGPAGNYVLLWDGTADITVSDWISGSLVSSSANRKVYRLSGGPAFVNINSTDPANPVRNIRLIQPDVQAVPTLAAQYPGMITDFENTYQNDIFHPIFLRHMRKFNTIRYMDWNHTNFHKFSRWQDRSTPAWYSQSDEEFEEVTITLWEPYTKDSYTSRGVAYEYQIRLCNEANANGWFCIPHAADDNYVRQLARMLRDQLNPNLQAVIELSNEVWGFDIQQQHFNNLGNADAEIVAATTDQPTRTFMAYVRRMGQVCEIFRQECGDSLMGTRIYRTLGVQVANNGVASSMLSYFNNAARSFIDAIAIAPYYTPSGGMFAAQTFTWQRERIIEHLNIAAAAGVDVVHYEGGQHYLGQNAATYSLDYRCYDHYIGYYNMIRDARGTSGNRTKLFCHYAYISPWFPAGDAWGMLDNLGADTAASGRWMATLDWMKNNARWWTTGREDIPVAAAPRAPLAPVSAQRVAGVSVRLAGRELHIGGISGSDIAQVRLVDMSGRTLAAVSIGAGADGSKARRWTIPESFAAGSYVLAVKTGDTTHRSVAVIP